MAVHLNCIRRLPAAAAGVWASAALAMGAQAPFTPPAPVSAAAAAAAAASAAQAPDGAAAPSADTAGLAGIRLGPGQAEALIDGQWWATGSRPRGASLLHVRRNHVQLRHPDGRLENLFLHPNANAQGLPAPRSSGVHQQGIAK